MTQADSVHSTPPTNTSKFRNEKFRDRLAEAYRQMEDEVHDLDRMSEIADYLVVKWVEISGRALPREGELATCMVKQLHEAVTRFKTKYLGAYDGDKEVT